ncbi:MAG: ShlB/FhaC/HecB family hemolysin secretion/activation protein [Gammaproteobacteria bacterium]|nr:MAG: ShlB/FhaC/HecB family hemolysin secretion/activation protein [Gammaproteobacteria bacterium]
MNPKIIIIVLALASALPPVAWPAAPVDTSAGAAQRRSLERLEQQRRQEALSRRRGAEKGLLPEIPQAPVEGGAAVRIPVTRIEVDRSRVLDPAAIRAITAPLEGRTVTLAQLQQAAAAISALYRQQGVLGRADVPPQRVREGRVRIRLIEPTIGELKLPPLAHTRPDFVRDRIGLQPGDLIDLNRLERDLLRLNWLYDLDLRTRLAPGRAFATSDLVFSAEEPPPYRGTVFVDDFGRTTIGRLRAGFLVTDTSLTGRRDPATIGLTLAEGTREAHLDYLSPLGSSDLRAGLRLDYTDIRVIDGPLKPLDVGGDSITASVQLRYPLATRLHLFSDLGLGFDWKQSDTDFSGVPISRSRVQTIHLDNLGYWFFPGGVLISSQAFYVGRPLLGGMQEFFRYEGHLSAQLEFGHDLTGVFRAGGQWSDRDNLPVQEQWQVGGNATVRGYPEGLLIGDTGYLVSAELRYPLFRHLPGLPGRWRRDGRGMVFLDHGAAFPFKGNAGGIDSDDFLTSAGIGFSLPVVANLTLQVQAGFPLVSRRIDSEDDYEVHGFLAWRSP